MRVMKLLSFLGFLSLSLGVHAADMSVLYGNASAALKNSGNNCENFLDTKLASANLSDKLEDLYFSSLSSDNSANGNLYSLTEEELNVKIGGVFESVDFGKVISSLRPDTKVEPLPKTIGGGKLTGLKVRRWQKTSAQAAEELKKKKDLVGFVKSEFANFEISYKGLNKNLKVKLYTYLNIAAKNINAANYEQAGKICSYIGKNIIKK